VFADAVTHWPGGAPRGFTFGSGESFAFGVNARYEPAAIRSGPLALDYTMTPAGDVAVMSEGATASSYSYDFRDRLVAFTPGYPTGTDFTDEYARSFLGAPMDRLKRSGTFTGSTLTSGYAFDYDFQTNVSSVGKIVNGAVTSAVCLRHDPLGRLAIVGSGPNGGGDQQSCVRDSDVTQVVARLRYDAQNRRVGRWLASSGDWTYFVHATSGGLLSELRVVEGAWSPIRDYVWLDGRPLAQIEYGTSGERRVYYIHADHLGMPRRLTNSQGSVVWSAKAQPYGEVAESVAADPATGQVVVTNLRLPGQYDERLFAAAGISGLQGPYYNWNRWYLPSMGRYMELDPIALHGGTNGPYGPDWYNYAEGNPLTKTDMFGLDVAVCTRPINLKYPPPYAKHCFAEFNGDAGDTVSFDPNGVHPDPAPNKSGTQCKPSPGPQNDNCIKKEMKKCKNYNFFTFNCCDCLAQALKACHVASPGPWPNWPFNPK
jgi:RHS repeat-associated protein